MPPPDLPVDIVCDSIRVPLDRAQPSAGGTTVAYALMRRRDHGTATSGTVAVNPGGPGAPTIPYALEYAKALHGLLNTHDLLLIDPRGTGQSGPIGCDALAPGRFRPTTRADWVRAYGQCGRALGHRARYYTSAAIADDFDAVRARLRIPQLDLHGLSYGTFLMTVYAQRHPTRVRSMVLSSAYPLKFDMWGRPNARAMNRALRLLCERSRGRCSPRQVIADLGTVAGRVRAHPLPYEAGGRRLLLDETALAQIGYNVATSNPSLLGRFPGVLRAAASGDTAPLVDMAKVLNTLPEQASPQEPALDPSPAQTAAVVCNDYPTLWNRRAPIPDRIRQFEQRRAALPDEPYRPFSVRGWTDAIIDQGDICLRWPDRDGPVQSTRGPFADVPVLVLSGDLDPNTPTASGRLAARQFRRAQVIEVPNTGHGPSFFWSNGAACAASLEVRFLQTRRAPDTGCLAQIPPIPVT
ncbi:alpha/beta fold hydrolase [Actinomadura sp. 9N215]|uniref:alpha/beta fold hydrolase n=1 Tax=Actinomadura sp. 9N215 TaxID=3375150 RepID=UPI00379DF886